MSAIVTLYLLVALWFFVDLLQNFQRDTYLSAREKSLSVKVLLIATIFWPIVAPISFISKAINSSNQAHRKALSSKQNLIQTNSQDLTIYQRYFY